MNSSPYVLKSNQYTASIFWETPPHKHAFFEIILICEGEAVHTVNDEPYNLVQNDLMLMFPDDEHSYKIKDPHNYLQFDFYATETDFSTIFKALTNENFRGFLENKPQTIHLDEEIAAVLHLKLTHLNYLSETDFSRVRPVYLSLLAFIQGLFIDERASQIKEIPEWYRTIVMNVSKPEILSGTVHELVKVTNFSHGYLCKIFKEYTGERLIDYFTRRKIDYAIQLLHNENLSVLDISIKCGYDSLSHFIRTFKKYCTLPPQEYRKKVIFSNKP